MFNLRNITKFTLTVSISLTFAAIAFAQTTAFTYQGRFTDSTLPQPTNSSYEMQYKLFDTSTVGTGLQNGTTQTVSSVSVINGIFTVQLDFGGGAFRANSIFIEIGVRPVGSAAAFTVLGPRQQITAAPLAVRSQISDIAEIAGDSAALGGIVANQYVQTNDARLADDRNPTAGSPNYVQNGTAPQASSNFNISNDGIVGGTLTANIVKATTQFNIGSNRVLSVGGGNIFAGVNTGTFTTGGDNTFVGTNTGMTNVTGFNNAFFGTDAGRTNTSTNNSFFGRSAGFATTTGGSNSFFGLDAGRFNTTGENNSFFGLSAGQNNTMGSNNSALGYSANFSVSNLSFATAIGAGSVVSTSNTIALGRNDGSDTVRIFGLGAAGGTALCRNAAFQISTCTAGGGSFIDNSTNLQAASNFNISGNGTAGGAVSGNIVNSATNFRIGGTTVFSTPNGTSVVAGQFANHGTFAPDSTFFGYNAGATTASIFAQANTFIGSEAGKTNSGGANNSFVGRQAGIFNSSGSSNSFFGSSAGKNNTTASDNSFFGNESGLVNTVGTRNSFFGFQAGSSNVNAGENAFFGYKAGTVNISGVQNTFVGTLSGLSSLNGASNSLFGYNADATGSKNTSIGADTNASGSNNTVVGYNAGVFGSGNTVIGYQAKTTGGVRTRSTVIGADAQVNKDNTIVLGTTIDTVEVPNLLTAKNIVVSSNVDATTVNADKGKFFSLSLTNITTKDIPMCLSSVNQTIGVCPITLNSKTAISNATLANTVNLQQTQINLQAEQIKQQKLQIEALTKIVCAMNPKAELCIK
jgi:hypothetical protein